MLPIEKHVLTNEIKLAVRKLNEIILCYAGKERRGSVEGLNLLERSKRAILR
jgi:hypothetical protein